MDSPRRRQQGAGVDLGADLDALLADHVRDAELVTGCDASQVSSQMLARAVEAVSASPDARAVFIECNPRDELLHSIAQAPPASPQGLDRLAIKYVPSVDALRALLSAWHCPAAGAAAAAGALTERDFLVWGGGSDMAPRDEGGMPDYMFIDGIDAVASAER
ncbi:hypothetical protein LPJ61_002008 [Coemansia biformis]|uniref:Uncharacterized protein n=1 Tax=Coemansia biformis TaxID=1286918 RepID=A0A9W8CXL1_9FUNG|nr:hypothetical protein LPJ61_002008 [Coemansia biformis]